MQSWQTCALSGELIETPVISRVSGHIFERRLIEKHIESTGTCPITGRPLNLEDLIEVKVARVQKPRPVTATSIPSILSLLQNEWDALLLEQFQLKQHLEQVRHELTHALYQHDAACRVIARVVRERDQARMELAQLQQKLGARIEMEAEKRADKLPANIIADIEQTALKLSNQRRAERKLPKYFEQFPTSEIISNYESRMQEQFQQSLTAVALNRDNQNLVAFGTLQGQVYLFDLVEKKPIFHSEAHTKKVTSIHFYYVDEHIRFVSTSEDGTIYFFTFQEGSTTSSNYKFEHPVASAAVHPIQYLIIAATANGIFTFFDGRSGAIISHVNDFEGTVEFTSIAVHPDGHILALGQRDSVIKVWSASVQKLMTQLEGQDGAVTNLAFSESGTQLASTSESEVVLWSLRNSEIIRRLCQGQRVGGVSFDMSGQYIAVGLNKSIELIDLKKFQPFCKIESHMDVVSSIAFGLNKIVSVSADKLLNAYSS